MNERGWRVPTLWPGATVYILGGGPSLNKVDVGRLRGQRVIAVNHAFKKAPWIDVMYFGDRGFYFAEREAIDKFAGLKVTTYRKHGDKPGVLWIKRRTKPYGIRPESEKHLITWNSSSGATAIGLAAHFGASKIILMGFDMRKIGGYRNWHSESPVVEKKDPYKRFLHPFPYIAADLQKMGIECINATPGSAIEQFPIVTPEEVYP